jgi:hypothetical protein
MSKPIDADDGAPASLKDTLMILLVCLCGCVFWVVLAVTAWMKWVEK